MPIKADEAMKVWARYAFMRDNGHSLYIDKADKCEAFFRGDQWDAQDRAALQLQRRPALTINKIISTVSNIMGEQIYNRSEISFRPRSGAPEEIAGVLDKVFKQISDANQLDWKRSDMFADGIITSRGFLDVRVEFDHSMQGTVVINKMNPKNVCVDPDADDYDPDTWNDVITTKWVTADDIAVLFNKEDAEILRNRGTSVLPFGYDSINRLRDRFGTNSAVYYGGQYDESSVTRCIRLVERQWRTLDNQKHFVFAQTGDMRPIPENFDRNKIAMYCEQFGLKVVKKLVQRIKWTSIADNIVLHEDWSPYKHFTVVPYFPYFRHGRTIGLVENLLDPQELLNKVSSQELHVVNTTANSGWKVKAGALTNMSLEELEQNGAQSGLVIEVNGDVEKDVMKIAPNQTPQGLDRISYKSEEHIKTISGVSDSAQGFDREDVAAKAIQAKRQASATNIAKPLDSLVRSDYILARNVLDLVQDFYTEERLMSITHDKVTGASETFTINQATPEGYVLNDLTLGEYDVVISSVPQRETLEDSQFDQAIAMKEQGVQIPDKFLIQTSRLINKKDLIQALDAQEQDPINQRMKQAQLDQAEGEAKKIHAEADAKNADAGLKHAKAEKETVMAHKEAMTPIEQEQGDGGAGMAQAHAAIAKTAADIDLGREKLAHQKQIDYAKLQMEQRKNKVDEILAAQKQAEDIANQRAQAAAQAQSNSQPSNP